MNRRILLVGATGTFGSRLAAMLARMTGVELVLAARRIHNLEDLRSKLVQEGAVADIHVRSFDRTQPEDIGGIAPWLVVDAAGPFQDSDYRLALAAVRAGANFIDLADSRDYVAGFPAAIDAVARDAKVLAVAAASSTPALSNAALEPLVAEWRRTDDVTVAISPGARAPRGLAVVDAILSYVGKPLRIFRQGEWQTVPGWSGLRRIYMPGLGRRYVSICETPDLDLLRERFKPRHEALFMAGLEVGVMHLGLAMLGFLVRWRLLSSLRPLAPPLLVLSDLLVLLGTDRGGMIVTASGRDAHGRALRARWAMWADAGSGPNVPAAPAAAMIRALLQGRKTGSGARVCVGLLTLHDIMREVAHLPIHSRVDTGYPDSPILFERLLGRRWASLPISVRTVHGGGQTHASGRAVARIGTSLPARTMRRIMGLPNAGAHAVTVEITPERKGERWTRRFGMSCFSSRLTDDNGNQPGLFQEHVGPLRFMFEMRGDERGVVWHFADWSFAGLPLPRWLGPRIRAGAVDENGLYRFRVMVAHRWFGVLFAYRGTLVLPSADGPASEELSSASLKPPS